ncbi:diguanylate cyclase (GGDEF)-like protein [Natronospira proteinivora]|uniref:diguanylate cyclase n=1 Tax=Natronospira proteinivora TaxID=1807133 RepID=A0ABT1G8J2_9GAMM|nr:diguanylate cyclase [Natronospira proteinivora]MCP1727639.1 diguanylate cyclase (GGDEF)-like protein [Natronospira proteinivora]
MERLSEGPVYERCLAALDEHIRRYFVERDIQATLAQYHDNAVGLGTGRGETAMDPASLREIVRNDLGGYTSSVELDIKTRAFYQVTPEVVISQMLLDFSITNNTHRMTLRESRHNLVWHLPAEGDPRICHVHVSFPTDLHGEEEPYPLKELEEVSQVVDELIHNRTQSLTESYRRLEQMVVRDRLTGMYNRVRIDEVLEQEVVRASRYQRHFSVIFLDLDHFKQINDNHGHLVGDKILKSLAKHIQGNIRETDTAARWGGEEFLIVLPETELSEAVQVAEKLRQAFEVRPFQLDGYEIPVTLSMGVACCQDGDNIEAILTRADKALYRAKANGRNRTES